MAACVSLSPCLHIPKSLSLVTLSSSIAVRPSSQLRDIWYCTQEERRLPRRQLELIEGQPWAEAGRTPDSAQGPRRGELTILPLITDPVILFPGFLNSQEFSLVKTSCIPGRGWRDPGSWVEGSWVVDAGTSR